MVQYPQSLARITLLTGIILLSSCGGGSGSSPVSDPPPAPVEYSYQQPADINDGWTTAHLDSIGADPQAFETLINNINLGADGYRFIDSVAVVKNNTLVFYEQLRTELDFADDWANNTRVDLHVINSVTKSVTSALVGIAIDQGYIAGVDVPVHDFFPHKQPIANWNEAKASISLEDWLTMRSGYDWYEWDISYLESSNLNSRMNDSSDPIQFLLDRPMIAEPGTDFAYSTGISFGLGRIVQLAALTRFDRFMERNLFDPLGIEHYTFWSLDNQLHTGSALYLSTRDMAKFGQLYLDGGVWQGQRIVSEAWVDASTQMRYDNGNWGYGYQWWMRNYEVDGQSYHTFYADGFGGQYIFVFPELDAVVVFTGDAYRDGEPQQRDISAILEQHILPELID